MIEVRLLQHALALADEGSFALAAQFLGMSQPALSRSIQSLESQLNVQLFERSHRRIEPTDAGQLFLERARDIVTRHADLARAVGIAETGANPAFTLAVGPYVADLIAGVALGRLLASQRDVQWRLRVGSWADAVKLVRAREADLAVADVSQIDDDPGLEVTPLVRIPGYLAVRRGHPLLHKRRPSLDEILTYPLVSTSRLPPRLLAPLQERRSASAAGRRHGFPAIICELVSVMRVVVAHSDAVGMFILPLIEREIADGSFVTLACDLPWLHTQFGIIRLRNCPLAPHGARLVAHLQQAAADLAASERALAQPRRRRSG